MQVHLENAGEGAVRLRGVLTLETAPALWKELTSSGLISSARSVELGALEDTDSAGLALLLTWRAAVLAQNSDLKFRSPPARLVALAKLTEIEDLLAG
jgi:phospholipid transport system transporter-binding protein